MPVRVCRPLLLAAIGLCAIIGGTDAHGQSVPSDTVVATTAPDAALEARLQGIYDQVTAFQDIEVRVRGGVHLSGTVVQTQQASEAAELARRLEGVVYVTNEVTAESDLANRVTPTLTRLQHYGTTLVEFLPVALIALLVVLATLGIGRWIGGWQVPEKTQLSPMAWGLVLRVLQFARGVDTLDAMNGVLPDPPPSARARKLGDSTVPLRFHGWANQDETDFHKVQSKALRLVKQAFDEADIEMPEPTYRL
jgi:hypothetical protein